MSKERTNPLADVSATVRAEVEKRLRAEGDWIEGDSLETLFAIDKDRDDLDCVFDCQDAFEAAKKACNGDDICIAGALAAYKKCLKKCGQ